MLGRDHVGLDFFVSNVTCRPEKWYNKNVSTNNGSCHRNPFPCDLRPVSSVDMPLRFGHEEQLSLV